MIIKGENKKQLPFKGFLLLFLVLVPLVLLRFYVPNKKAKAAATIDKKLVCDAENIENENFVSDGIEFGGGHTQSDEYANSGMYSCKLSGQNRFGMTYVMENPIPGSRYKVEAWSYNKHPVSAYLVVSDDQGGDFYHAADHTVERRGDYWERWELTFAVPQNNTPDKLRIYVYKNDGPNTIYFDDLSISILEEENFVDNELFEAKEFVLTIDKEGVDKLSENRRKSIAQGLVFHDGSKVSAKVWDEDRAKKAKIRHKGDWLDHMGKNPSYRVDMASDESWHGMQSFSVQECNTRGFIREWVFYKFLDFADVMRPRYDFIYFKQNTKDRIVFSFEEHFGKNLVEYRNRREGPIVKMTEDRIWEVTKRTIDGWKRSLPTIDEKDKAYWTSELRAFKEGKLLKNEKLMKDFGEAQNLLHQFKYNLKPASEIFDLDRMAKYLALVDICLAHHAVTWHNQRFYYNPVTSLLEPIGFDAYSSEDPQEYAKHIYSEKLYIKGEGHKEPIDWLFYDEDFVKKYFNYLDQYSSPDFINKFLDGLEEGVVVREKFINQRHDNYKFDREFIKRKATKIHISLPAHVNSLAVFEKEQQGDTKILRLANRHNFPLEILTGGSQDGSNIIYPQVLTETPVYRDWEVASNVRSIQYKIPGIDSVYTTPILKWKAPDDYTSRQALLETSDIKEFAGVISVGDDGHFRFNKGKQIIDKPLIIPSGKRVYINAGTEILFMGAGFLLSYSPVFISGDAETPVIISSEDGKAGSFTVMQAAERSMVRHAIFRNQNTLKYKGWQLTGAVNFYESDVDLVRSSFENNQCEDALNTIRSEFHMDECRFVKTFADAFDTDFCTGKIVNTNFTNVGNDAIDGSGSVLEIVGVKINKTGDKGVSAGEQSNIKCTWTEITDSPIGIASKDKSVFHIDQLKLKNCQTGFAAFQKKPEFGPATIYLNNYTQDKVSKLFMIEEKSKLVEAGKS